MNKLLISPHRPDLVNKPSKKQLRLKNSQDFFVLKKLLCSFLPRVERIYYSLDVTKWFRQKMGCFCCFANHTYVIFSFGVSIVGFLTGNDSTVLAGLNLKINQLFFLQFESIVSIANRNQIVRTWHLKKLEDSVESKQTALSLSLSGRHPWKMWETFSKKSCFFKF